MAHTLQGPSETGPLPQGRPSSRRAPIGWLAATAALATAVLGAIVSGPAGGPLILAMDTLSASAADVLRQVGTVLPLGFAFGAGMMAAVNPCGFALLPAYIGLYLGTNAPEASAQRPLAKALLVSATLTTSFILFFGAVGLLLSVATTAVARYFPWGGLVAGVLLVLVGGRMLAGGSFYASLPERLGSRLGGLAGRSGLPAYFGYGLTFALASLGCTLPIFLAVVGSALTAQGVVGGLGQFLLYGLGMGFVLTSLTLAAAWFRGVALGPARRLGRYLEPASALLLLLTGSYVVYYWLTLGGLLGR
jgi:cytochrome c-type biogenesis protein